MKLEILNGDGSMSPYVPLEDRLPRFLQAFPPQAGYAVVIDHEDCLGVTAARSAAFNEFVSKCGPALFGNRANEGDPQGDATGEADDKETSDIRRALMQKLMAPAAAVFTAKLINTNQDRIIAKRSALKTMESYEDWEKGETKALQRLMAAVGFGSADFLADETDEIAARNRATRESMSDRPEPETATEVAEAEPKEPVKPKQDAASRKPAKAEQSAPGTDDERYQAVANQIKNIARMRGVEIDVPSEYDAAKKVLKQLMRENQFSA
jgi:hypothetical protein